MPEKPDVIQHRVKLTDDTPTFCKNYSLPYAIREELWNEVGSMLEITEVDPEYMTMAKDMFRRLSGKKYLSKIDLT